MILYHVITTYHLLSIITHKLNYHRNEEAVLIIPDFLVEKHPNYLELVQNKIFKEVYIFHYRKIGHDKKTFIDNTRNEYTDNIPYKLSEFDEINIAGAQYYFTSLLLENNIHFNFFEEGSSALSNPDALFNISKGLNPNLYEFGIDNGLYTAINPLIDNVFYNFSTQKKGFKHEKGCNFNLNSELEQLPNVDIDFICSFFNAPSNLETEPNSVLVLTQHFANLKILSFEEQILIYQLLIDYYYRSEVLVFKPHPDDLLYYDLLFSNSIKIKGRFPSELLPFIFTNRPHTALTISSTSILNIKQCFKEIMTFSNRFEQYFKALHKYFIVYQFLQYIKIYSKVLCIGIEECILNNFYQRNKTNNNLKIITTPDDFLNIITSIILIDDIDYNTNFTIQDIVNQMKILDDNSIMIFINQNQNYSFYYENKNDLLQYLVPIKITKNAVRSDNIYSDLDDETIWIYVKGEKMAKMVTNFKTDIELENSGLKIQAEALNGDKLQIKILEGILSATERRLNYYIKREKELLNILENRR